MIVWFHAKISILDEKLFTYEKIISPTTCINY